MALQTDLRAVQTLGQQTLGQQTLGQSVPEPLGDHPRCLCRFEDGLVFAYAERGRDFIRASDRELWAVQRDDALVSARSGATLAQRRGRVYFDVETNAPLYYERAI